MLGIITILATLLLPVAMQARMAATRTVCANNLHQAFLAMQTYMQDYEDHYTPVNYQPGPVNVDPKTDRTWVQLLLPYAKNLTIFHCPADFSRRNSNEVTFDEDLVPTDTYQRYYTLSQRSDIGFNYAYLSPVVEVNGVWQSLPRTGSDVADPSKTLLFVDSIWTRGPLGDPEGGGSWLVTPPCRYQQEGDTKIDTFKVGPAQQVYVATPGWSAEQNSDFVYGHAWPWHGGRMNIAHVDGSIKSATPNMLQEGCAFKPGFNGLIQNANRYIWAAQ